MHEWGGLTRFADSVRSTRARRARTRRSACASCRRAGSGVASTNDFSAEGARAGGRERAWRWPAWSAPDPQFPGLARSSAARGAPGLRRGDGVGDAGAARRGGWPSWSGSARTASRPPARTRRPRSRSASRTPRASSARRRRRRPRSPRSISGGEGGNGFAETLRRGGRRGRSGRRSAGGRPRRRGDAAAAGRWSPARITVVLEPAAVSTLVGFLAFIGLRRASTWPRAARPRRASEGQQVAAPSVSHLGRRDGSAHARAAVRLRGRAAAARRSHQGRRVRRRGVRPANGGADRPARVTGHALPSPNPEGPFPLNMFMATGDASVEDMIAATDRGRAGDALPLLERRASGRVQHHGHDARRDVADRGRRGRRSRSRTSGSRSRSWRRCRRCR